MGLPFAPPSPLQRLDGLAEPWSRARIWVKRDDLLGAGGTKVRKLAAALPAAKAARRRTVLTFGHEDSNHALVTAAAAREAGLSAELWIEPAPGAPGERRAALDVSADRVDRRGGSLGLVTGAALRALALALRGRRPWILPPGGTTPATCAAVACAVVEVADQVAALGEPIPPRWAVAVGSGGTFAGLLAGARALDLPCRITGFSASAPGLVRAPLVAALANAALDQLGLAGHLSADEVDLAGAQLGGGHGVATEASRRAEIEWASGGGVTLDPIFGAKAAAGMREAIEQGPPGAGWLFWQTGMQVEMANVASPA